MSYETFNKLSSRMWIFGLALWVLLLHVQTVQANHKLEVQQVCDRSHVVMNGTLEKSCGDIQDRYHAEYLCNGTKPDAVCWVELK